MISLYKISFLLVIIVSCSPKISEEFPHSPEEFPKSKEKKRWSYNPNIPEDDNLWILVYMNGDMKYYDSTSIVPKENISQKDLEGQWDFYQSIGQPRQMDCRAYPIPDITSFLIFEAKGNTFRGNKKQEFREFRLKENLIFQQTEAKIDTGFIHKITPNELVITWKTEFRYATFFYNKKGSP